MWFIFQHCYYNYCQNKNCSPLFLSNQLIFFFEKVNYCNYSKLSPASCYHLMLHAISITRCCEICTSSMTSLYNNITSTTLLVYRHIYRLLMLSLTSIFMSSKIESLSLTRTIISVSENTTMSEFSCRLKK